jgi:ubiquinone/menaquinone biosynthesis C-methylase UbiE
VTNVQKINLEQVGRQYLMASNLEMAWLIIDKTGIYQGKCLELAAGAGYLGFALAESIMMEIYLLENNRDALKQAQSHIARSKASDRINVIRGSVLEIPLPDDSMHLVTSKKSIFTWNNRLKIFKEIYRVLTPGGVACLCGGFESQDIQFHVNTRLADVNPKLLQSLHIGG